MSRFEQARSPAGHHDPEQLVSWVPVAGGACEHGAANQVLPPSVASGSARALGGQTETEQGVDPNWHVPAQAAPPPAAHVPDENPAWLTNSSVTSRANKIPPLRHRPPPPANPEPLK